MKGGASSMDKGELKKQVSLCMGACVADRVRLETGETSGVIRGLGHIITKGLKPK